MSPTPLTSKRSRQPRRHRVRWNQPSQDRKPAQVLLRGNRNQRGATAAGRDVIVGTDLSCPHCGYDDQVQAVPAIRASGTSTTYGTSYYAGSGFSYNGLIPISGAASTEHAHVTSLAQALAPEPVAGKPGKLILIGLGLLLPALFAVLVTIAAAREPGRTVSLPSLIATWAAFTLALATPSILLFAAAVRRIRISNRITRGRPRSYPLWNAGKYCHRCACCFWPDSVAHSVPARHPLSPNEFREIVWAAGGYARA